MKTVLVVEDSLTDRETLSRRLQNSGFLVVSATNVEEAQAKLAQKKPDLIFLDVILPGQSGFEFCRALKTDPDTKEIPVIICSTKGTDVDKTWGTMLGADEYLTKPLGDEAFQQVLRRFA